MASGRWQPSAVSPAVWDSFTWSDPNAVEGSVAGVTTTAGTALGIKGALGISAGTTTTAGTITGAVGFAGLATGDSTTSGANTGSPSLSGTTVGSSASSGSATGTEQDQGVVGGVSVTAGAATGSPDLFGEASGDTTSTGSATGSKPAPAPVARTGRVIPLPKQIKIERKGEVFAWTRTIGSATGVQGFAGEARRGFTQTEGRATRSSFTYRGSVQGQEIVIERRLDGIVKIHRIVRQREEDALLTALR